MLYEMVCNIDVVLVKRCLEAGLVEFQAIIRVIHRQSLIAASVPHQGLNVGLDPE